MYSKIIGFPSDMCVNNDLTACSCLKKKDKKQWYGTLELFATQTFDHSAMFIYVHNKKQWAVLWVDG